MKLPEQYILPGRRKYILGAAVGYLAIGGAVELFGIPLFAHSANFSAKIADELALVTVGVEAALTGFDVMIDHFERQVNEPSDNELPENSTP
jgi:hypothetical protein